MSQRRIESLARELGLCLKKTDHQLSTVESCTGGWIAQAITSIAGSSAWFDRGFVTYSNQAKTEMVGVDTNLLADQGAVSEAVAKAMAQGGLLHSNASACISVTGIAGPDGGSMEKPVGTVFIAWAIKQEETVAERLQFAGDRQEVREQTVHQALQGMIKLLE